LIIEVPSIVMDRGIRMVSYLSWYVHPEMPHQLYFGVIFGHTMAGGNYSGGKYIRNRMQNYHNH